MATANNNKMERFAFDVFVFSMSKFKTKAVIPSSKYDQNTYEPPDLLLVISHALITYQLQLRDCWKIKFENEFKSNGLKKFGQISKLLDEIVKVLEDTWKTSPRRALISLSLISELIQFRYSKNCRLFLNDLASWWKNYIDSMDKQFEEQGGIQKLYSFHTKKVLTELGKFNNRFITKYCHRYGEKQVSVMYMTTVVDYVPLYLSDESDQSELESHFATLSITSKPSMKSGNKKNGAYTLLENTGLGIRPHEELLQYSYSHLGDDGTSQKCDEASAAAPACQKLYRKLSGQKSQIQDSGIGELSTQITRSENKLGDRAGLARSPLSLEGQSKGCGGLTDSTATLQEQKPRRVSVPKLKGKSRLEQKRQKYIQKKKP